MPSNIKQVSCIFQYLKEWVKKGPIFKSTTNLFPEDRFLIYFSMINEGIFKYVINISHRNPWSCDKIPDSNPQKKSPALLDVKEKVSRKSSIFRLNSQCLPMKQVSGTSGNMRRKSLRVHIHMGITQILISKTGVLHFSMLSEESRSFYILFLSMKRFLELLDALGVKVGQHAVVFVLSSAPLS